MFYIFQAKFKNCKEFFPSWKSQTVPSGQKHLILKLSPTVYDPLGLNSPFTVKACLDLSKVEDLNCDIKTLDKFAEHWSDWQVDLFQLVSVSHFLQFKSSKRHKSVFFECFWKSLCLLRVYSQYWVSYRRDCKGGEWWQKSCCSLSCNFQSSSNPH
jgi:hypothetical protein